MYHGSAGYRKTEHVPPETEIRSYGAATPEDLLLAMVDDPGEYNELAAFVQKFQGFDVSFSDKVDEAKN